MSPPWVRALRPAYLLPLLALIPSALAVLQLGRIHPDEVYQTLEPAFWKANGYGILAWEWQQGIRNWVIPGIFAWILRLARLVGLEHPQAYRAALEAPQFLLHLWALRAVFRYALRRTSPDLALAATALVALWGPTLTFAGRTLGESFSAEMLIIGLELLDRSKPGRVEAILSGLWIGFSVIARYGSLVFAAAIFISLAVRRQGTLLLRTAAGFAVAAMLLGWVDFLTWGSVFHSLVQYVGFNVFSTSSAQMFGEAPWYFYSPWILLFLPPWSWPGVFFTVRKERAVPPAIVAATVYVFAISLTAHKEVRFLYPALALVGFATAPAFVNWCASLKQRGLAWGMYAAAIVLSWVALIPFKQMKPLRGDQFRAIVRAARGSDATGLLIVGDGLWGVGGFFYIGKNIPWNRCDSPQERAFQMALRDPTFNRAVTYAGIGLSELEAGGFRVVDQIGEATVLSR